MSVGYAKIARNRSRELRTRCVIAVFIAITAWFLAPSIWPAIWLGAVFLTQALDWTVFRPLRARPDMTMSTDYKALCCATAAVNVIVYSGIAAYLWYQGGEAGRLFGIIQIAGGLLHVSLHMHQVRPLLLSAVIPHATYFLGLPALGALEHGRGVEWLIVVGGCLYMMHLVVAVRQGSAATALLEAANRDALRHREQAEIANAAKTDFLAMISHEIRTPMNAVVSAATLLQRTPLDARQRDHVSMLTDAGEVMIGLLDDVLDLSKIEAGKLTLEITPMGLAAKLRSAHRLWEHRATAKGIGLAIDLADDLPARVMTDPLRFQQILFNLLSNGIKFTDEGRITLGASWRSADETLVIIVEDTGCGIPGDRLDGVFKIFEQAEAGTTRRYGGTGLGLSISRRLAEQMGGSLTVESELGIGSRFTLILPLQAMDADLGDSPVESDLAIALSGRRILVADDHPVNRKILGLLLEPHGCTLVMVENGLEAVEAADADVFDAILMDMQMPVMDGLEATRRIRRSGQNRNTPVIALTANALDLHRAAWDGIGVHAYLTKPIDAVLLTTTLSLACSVKASAREGVAA